jgi:hypothetical protein
MSRLALSHLLAAVAVLAMLGGCGFTNPYQSSPTHSTTTQAATRTPPPADQRDPPPERGGMIPPAARAPQSKLAGGAGRPTPHMALERYTAMYLNWTAANVIAAQRRLASISLKQARAQALQAAASAARDPQLTNSHLANHGRVIAVSPGQGDAAGKWVIVTSEQTSGQGDYQGLPPTLHIIYAQLTNTSQGWVISGWLPQN